MLKNKVVLITGGTGSFGKKCVETILTRHQPKKIIVFSRDEFKQFDMARKFSQEIYPIRFFLGDVRDKERLKWAFQDVDYIIHAAAMKQVPASEYNPTESIKTNIIGSENVVNVAADCGVEKVIALSTDKAVNPVNLYGATKLCAEKLFIAANAFVGRKKCMYAVVRYGNVMGSRGSVIPFFLKKRQEGVLPITHPDMTRFWLSLSQSVDFVLNSLKLMTGGETFIPKLPSLNIMDLAKFIAPECKTKIVGIRQGEKIHETLISQDEARNTLGCPDFFLIKPDNSFFRSQIDETNFGNVPEGFEYNSKTNDEWVTKAQIDQIIASMDQDC
ncbi:MAG: UDP-N-acetylglucosamine 4,6-dehydratase (inverting) [Desulfobacula sp.]|jgi:UDP-N-acetylglucosamine 4,6-dehydratase|nr:UDP-N-acetylglucosamine 4,6-dehydratase (inverting) [Desulfobacula sp.]